jgi:hypothetical protein
MPENCILDLEPNFNPNQGNKCEETDGDSEGSELPVGTTLGTEDGKTLVLGDSITKSEGPPLCNLA